jgi:hypothetical protein
LNPYSDQQTIIDWLRHLDWGNVPSWASAGSLIVAAAVYARDRRRYQRRQVDEVAAWRNSKVLTLGDDSLGRNIDQRWLKINLRITNSSKLPVRKVEVQYRLYKHWDGRVNFQAFSRVRRVWVCENIPPDCTVHPDELVTGRSKVAGMFGSGEWRADARIECALVIDSSGKKWVSWPERGWATKPARILNHLHFILENVGRERHS